MEDSPPQAAGAAPDPDPKVDPKVDPDPDPEVEALLDFPPVVRKCVRHDGWLPEKQRRFIVRLAALGSPERAAHAAGGTMSGVYKLRSALGGEGFAAAWDSALALHLERNPRKERRGRPSGGERLAFARAAPPPPPPDPREEAKSEALHEQGMLKIFDHYVLKLETEREARLAGRVAEADFLVRQVTWLEVALDIGGHGEALIAWWRGLKLGDRFAGDIVATPISVLVDHIRRSWWKDWGEPERPLGPPLGRHDDHCAWGPPLESQAWPERDGEGPNRPGLAAYQRRNTEAVRAWESKAKEDAKAWAERIGHEPPPEDSLSERIDESLARHAGLD